MKTLNPRIKEILLFLIITFFAACEFPIESPGDEKREDLGQSPSKVANLEMQGDKELEDLPILNNSESEYNASSRDKIRTSSKPVPEAERVYHITLNPDPDFDNTKLLQDQLDAIPNGDLIEGSPDILKVIGSGNEWAFEELEPNINYVDIYLPKGEYWTEGYSEPNVSPYNSKRLEGSWVTILRERKYIRIHGEGTTFYTKAPSVPYLSNAPKLKNVSPKNYIFKGYYSHRRHFALKKCENVEIYGLTIKGSNYTEGKLIGRTPEKTPPFWPEGQTLGGSLPGYPGYVGHWEFEHGFDIGDSKNIKIEGCTVENVWGDGYYQHKSSNVILRNSTARYIGRMGWATPEGGHTLIDNVLFNWIRWSGIDFEPDDPGQKIEFVEVRNCTWDKNQLYAVPAGGNGAIDNINIHNNDLGNGGLYLRINDPKPTRPDTWIIRKNWRWNDNINCNDLKAVWVDNMQVNRNEFVNKSADFFKPTAIRNLEVKDNVLKGGTRITTALCGTADYEPYASEKFEISGNTPEPGVQDQSNGTTEAGKALYEKMKKLNPLEK